MGRINTHETDLIGNYKRFPDKALRIAMMLASLENDNRMEMRHWSRAQMTTEGWRRCLHHLRDQLTRPQASAVRVLEDKLFAVMKRLRRKGSMLPRQPR